MIEADSLRAEAEYLVRQLPDFRFQSGKSDARHAGTVARRKPGLGEKFWQYRRYTPGEPINRIDWRRSASSDLLYVRDSELETAQTVLFWCDSSAGFDWSGSQNRRTKADEAKVIATTLGAMFVSSGERVGVLGSQRRPSFGTRAVDRLARELCLSNKTHFPTPPKNPAFIVVISDFYSSIESWHKRLCSYGEKNLNGVLLAIADPVEKYFPFKGRTQFQSPDAINKQTIGRAEEIREDYLDRLDNHRRQLQNLASTIGWRLVEHTTDSKIISGIASLLQVLDTRGQKY